MKQTVSKIGLEKMIRTFTKYLTFHLTGLHVNVNWLLVSTYRIYWARIDDGLHFWEQIKVAHPELINIIIISYNLRSYWHWILQTIKSTDVIKGFMKEIYFKFRLVLTNIFLFQILYLERLKFDKTVRAYTKVE